ncbi:MAG: D-alanine--D-alanine ligase [Phycisphaerae bacterium]|nr:D-alanine--D-alanine ligase [Phycisphaerae bacterium]NIP51323.1 D-alanine--D-alanine ligase [Phycisphaerae bacterium]NIS50517.1 D-alanine--D-alanine ligase [Phycisphaerae bacterium]NIU08252.1 D-alanine--D-alanine ligase [Phycisphaerae bacterium]NIU55748.1 D-alanine--D-alanine ligase [Phycisphaerae bacterium]
MTIESSANSQSQIVQSRLKVAVLMGGIGEERDVSIQSGTCVAQALEQAGFNVITSDIAPDNMDILEDGGIDVFFIALHGKFGEDGRLQQILEDKSLLYTGSGPAASRLAFDKIAAKKAFTDAGVITPKAIIFDQQTNTKELPKELPLLGEKFVVKPIRQGSTVGVTIVDEPGSAVADARQCLRNFGDCMIEEYIDGREITVGILGNSPLPIIEIKTKTGFYDYEAKYIDEQTQYLFDTIDEETLAEKIAAAALDCFNTLGCRHFARADFILSKNRLPYVLEINTIPGFTSHSLLPMAAAKTGLSMSDLCTKIIEAAYSSLANSRT